MSQQPLTSRPVRRATPRPTTPQRPPLRVVAPTPRRVGRIPFIVFCSILMTLGLGALLALNLSLVAGAYELHDVTEQVEALRAQESELIEKVALRSTPSELATRAKELGMVTGGTPAYLKLKDGSVVGNPTPAPSGGPNRQVPPPPNSSPTNDNTPNPNPNTAEPSQTPGAQNNGNNPSTFPEANAPDADPAPQTNDAPTNAQ